MVSILDQLIGHNTLETTLDKESLNLKINWLDNLDFILPFTT